MAFPPLRPATFIRRLNRFAVLVDLDGAPAVAHLPNSGRLEEVLIPGNRLWLAAAREPGRRTGYDLALAMSGHELVSVDARVPNHLLGLALERGAIPELAGYTDVRREVRLSHSRLDFVLGDGDSRCLLEVKSVTLVVDGVALFPDAPTLRGQRHLELLASACHNGEAAAVLFLVQRSDASALAPHRAADPAFAYALREAARAGVQVLAYRCQVTLEGIGLLGPLPVRL